MPYVFLLFYFLLINSALLCGKEFCYMIHFFIYAELINHRDLCLFYTQILKPLEEQYHVSYEEHKTF
jgi:hypothetical protein